MAEGLFRHTLKGQGGYRVLSAGVGAIDGQPPSPHAVRALKELGIDISALRSRALRKELIDQADYIFGMTHSHVDAITMIYPQASEKTFCSGSLTRRWKLLKKISPIQSPALTKSM